MNRRKRIRRKALATRTVQEEVNGCLRRLKTGCRESRGVAGDPGAATHMPAVREVPSGAINQVTNVA